MSTGRKAPPTLDFEIPDLDLTASRRPSGPASQRTQRRGADPRPPGASAPPLSSGDRSGVRSAARPVAAPAAARAQPQDYFGSGNFDADHFGGSEVAIALDIDDGPPLSARSPSSPRSVPHGSPPSARARPPGGAIPSGPASARGPASGRSIPSGPSSRSGQHPAAPPAPAVASEVSAYFGSGNSTNSDFGDDDFGDGFGDLDDGAPMETATAARPSVREKWPSGVSPTPADLQVNPGEVDELSGYGTPPAIVLLAPLYSYRVLTRKAELKRKIDVLSKQLLGTEQARDEQLACLVRDSWSILESRDDTRGLLEAIATGEQQVESQQQALAGKNAEYDQAMTSLTRRIADVDAQISAAEAQEAAHSDELEGKELALGRLEAKKKRLYIEIRSIVDLAEKAGGAITAEQSDRVRTLETQVAAMKPGVDAATVRVAQARAAADVVRQELRTLRRSRDTLRKETQNLNQRFEKQIGAFTSELERASKERLGAYADVGRRILELKGRVPVDEGNLESLRGADARVVSAATELERHAQALHAFDGAAYRKGFVLTAVVAVMMVAIVLFLALR